MVVRLLDLLVLVLIHRIGFCLWIDPCQALVLCMTCVYYVCDVACPECLHLENRPYTQFVCYLFVNM